MPSKKKNNKPLDAKAATEQKPRLVKLIVKNYRCIGSKAVEIDLDDIVVLVGANNVGKSSILKAYEVAMSEGSVKAELELEDFPNRIISKKAPPEIEVHSVVYDESVGKKWITKTKAGEKLVRERWVWKDIGKPKRQGWNAEKKRWDEDKVPWGAANYAKSRRPEPHRVNAFDSPEAQAEAITKLLMKTLRERIESLKGEDASKSDYGKLLDKVKAIQQQIVKDTKAEIEDANKKLTELIEAVFPGYKIDFDAKAEDSVDKSINLFKADPQLLMGESGKHMTTIDRQGSGARRTLLWTALKFIAESEKKSTSSRPHLLLIDEPEICLHPNAIREACKALYDLPSSGNWQVMVTTHSPVFIDFSKDNTTIVRVEKGAKGKTQGTTVFRPGQTKLDESDRQNLKMLNICDPYVAEFFFGGRIIIVEGDTEYTAFNYIRSVDLTKYSDVHIIRARGKATIVTLSKILDRFGARYSILHDSDLPTTKSGTINPAWSNNEVILKTVNSALRGKRVRLLASVPNFEGAYLNLKARTSEKPYYALKKIMEDKKAFANIKQLFDSLLDFKQSPPSGCHEWNDIDELKKTVKKKS